MNRNPEVDEWFAEFDHPLVEAMQKVRKIILSDSRMTEAIKWKSPTFMYEGNLASIDPKAKKHTLRLLHHNVTIVTSGRGADIHRYRGADHRA